MILKRVHKIVAQGLSVALIAGTLCGCGITKKELPIVQISLWTDVRNEAVLKENLGKFKEIHKDEAVFEFAISLEGEDTCKATVLSNPAAAADVYTFADDQLEELYRGNALLEITQDVDEVLDAVGGRDSAAAMSVLRNGKMYAYPETAGNGYYLYYNKKYFSEDDIKTLDRILEVCKENGKKFTMDYSSGWYIYSFFKGAGLELACNETGDQNSCNWNSSNDRYSGIDVANAMMSISKNDAFVSLNDEGFVTSVQNDEIIAGVNGPWNAEIVSAVWKENYGAAKLPTYTVNGNQEQMHSFVGYKMIGVNAYTKNPEWCMELAKFLTNEENQLKRFQATGECPVNLEAAKTKMVQESPAVAALAAQAPYSHIQNIADPYWRPASKLGITLSSGNLDNNDLQKLLDDTQKEIVKKSDLVK